MQIRKANGTIEDFNEKKLINALVKTGAKVDVAMEICDYVKNKCVENYKDDQPIKTEYIYHLAFKHLKNISKASALKYSLKRSMLEIGPSGFPFEKFIAEVWRHQGFDAVTGQMIMGQCVAHEVDVVAWNKDKLVMIEAKYHSDAGSRTDLKNALYVKARYDDIESTSFSIRSFVPNGEPISSDKMPEKLSEGWLITNTYFSETAITYAECNDLKLMSFDYPEDGSLQDRIIEYSLYPITILTTLTKEEKKRLIDRGIILCQTLRNRSNELEDVGVNKDKTYSILEEIGSLL